MTMKFFILGFFPLLLASVAPAQTASSGPPITRPRTDECAISGIVVKLAGSEPVKTAMVQLQNLQDLAHTVSVVTDVSGRFELKGIDPGRYRGGNSSLPRTKLTRPSFPPDSVGCDRREGPG